MQSSTNSQLKYLHDLSDWKVHNDDPDIRGYSVYTEDNVRIGKVKGLLASPSQRRVRYVDIETTRDIDVESSLSTQMRAQTPAAKDEDHSLVPIGLVRVDTDDERVTLTGVNARIFQSGPRHRHGSPILPAYEIDTVNHYDSNYNDRSGRYDRRQYDQSKYAHAGYITDGKFYDNEYFDESATFAETETSTSSRR